MKKFGSIRLSRNDLSWLHKTFFRVLGVSPDHKLRFMFLNKLLISRIANKSVLNVLDAGCGEGDYSFFFSEKFPHAQIDSVDIDESRIARNQALASVATINNISFRVQDLENFNEENKYDIMCCVDVLEHIPNQKKVLENLDNALKPGGLFYIHLPIKKERPVIFDKYITDFHHWAEEEHLADDITKDEFLLLLEAVGFRVIEVWPTFNHYLGELTVSLTMLFGKKNIVNQLVRAFLSPLMNVLVGLDLAIKNKKGNAVAIVVTKE
ncbi:class I SAM-dependent methyltransferase [Thermodesulfobacteriota bacterium]